jgi:hypothetical protein
MLTGLAGTRLNDGGNGTSNFKDIYILVLS